MRWRSALVARIAGLLGLIVLLGAFGSAAWTADKCHREQNCGGYHPAEYKTASGSVPESADDRVADYTWWLAISTAALVATSIFQGYFLIRADGNAKDASDAALSAANVAKIQAEHLKNSVAEAKRAADEMANVAKAMNNAAISSKDAATATRQAADYTKDGANAAAETAKAMHIAADAMSKQATLAHQTYLAMHRPRIIIHSLRLQAFDSKSPPDQQPLRCEFSIINGGTGVCKMVIGSAVYLEYLYPIDRPHLPTMTRNDVIPQRRFEVGATDNSIVVTSDEYGGLNHVHAMAEAAEIATLRRLNPGKDIGARSPRKTLYLHGWVVYAEDSGHTRTTYFRRVYKHDTERFVTGVDEDDEATY